MFLYNFVCSSFCRFLPVFSTVLAKILFAMAKTQPCSTVLFYLFFLSIIFSNHAVVNLWLSDWQLTNAGIPFSHKFISDPTCRATVSVIQMFVRNFYPKYTIVASKRHTGVFVDGMLYMCVIWQLCLKQTNEQMYSKLHSKMTKIRAITESATW